MGSTRRDVLSGMFVGGVIAFSGCTTSFQSGSESDSQATTNGGAQPSANTNEVTSASTSDLQPTPQSSSVETIASEEPLPTGEAKTARSASNSGPDTQSEVGIGENQNWSEKDRPQAAATVGDSSQINQYDKPHSVRIWNDDTDSRTIHVSLVPATSQKHNGFQRDFQLKPDSYAVVKIARYQSYILKVGINENPLKKVTQLPKSFVDCNYSSTDVAVRSDGSLDSTSVSTMMACDVSTIITTTNNSS